MSHAATKTAVIVDAYSSGARLPAMFRNRGWTCIHVQSTTEVPPPYRASFPGPSAFADHVVFDGDLDRLAAVLRRYHPDAVVAGSEPGVLLQDRLSDALGLPGNPVETSLARRDKYHMQERLKACGVPHIPQMKAIDAETLITFAEDEAGWPLVIKPTESVGGDNVSFCADADAVRRAVDALINSVNVLGLENREVLGQRQLRGDEYVVNAVFRDGGCFVSEIWRIHRQVTTEQRHIYDYGELLDATGQAQTALRSYFERMTRALDFRNGAAHAEIMMTDQGPVLIEIGARPAGAVSHATTNGALGYSHPSLLVESICRPEDFAAHIGTFYQRREHAQFVSLITKAEGKIADAPGYSRVSRLPSFIEAVNPRRPGDRISRTVDLFTSPGLVYLRHPDRVQIDRDRAEIRRLEKNEFFVTEAG